MPDERQEVSPEKYEVIKAVLGADAETFRRTSLGQYIYGRIANEEEQLIEELIAADPEDAKENRRIRNEIYQRRTLPRFIDEAVQSGHAAQRNIEQMESNKQDY
jgi:anti-sigma factor RsiW